MSYSLVSFLSSFIALMSNQDTGSMSLFGVTLAAAVLISLSLTPDIGFARFDLGSCKFSANMMFPQPVLPSEVSR